MWTSERRREFPVREAPAELGTVTLGGDPAGVVLRIGSPAASSMERMYLCRTGTDMPSFLAAAVWLPVSSTP